MQVGSINNYPSHFSIQTPVLYSFRKMFRFYVFTVCKVGYGAGFFQFHVCLNGRPKSHFNKSYLTIFTGILCELAGAMTGIPLRLQEMMLLVQLTSFPLPEYDCVLLPLCKIFVIA